jgi:nitrate reductase NapAB chaperone NapD
MSDVHIASCVAFARPEAVEGVVRAILATRLAEVPRHDGRGRLVVLIERGSTAEVLDVIDAIRALDGVLAVHLAYQHSESAAEMEKPQ